MGKSDPPIDVLVIGDHPATYLAAAVLAQTNQLRVVHTTRPGVETVDQLVLVSPQLFDLHKLLETLRRKINATAYYGLQFLSDQPEIHSESRSKSAAVLVAWLSALGAAMAKLAQAQGAQLVEPRSLEILRIDESGVDLQLGKSAVRARMLLVGDPLTPPLTRLLNMPDAWDADAVHRIGVLKLKGVRWSEMDVRPVVPMSLDLDGTLGWAWMVAHDGVTQLTVEQSMARSSGQLPDLQTHWAAVLRAHGWLKTDAGLPLEKMKTMEIPYAGAMSQEGVANRTLLFGPAGGFYAATGEDIYPNCWSALFAAEVAQKALQETHLQDALQPYRHKWRTTLGDYLRGPQQNLRFLLPLVYRNQVMTDRLTESILLGKSIVR